MYIYMYSIKNFWCKGSNHKKVIVALDTNLNIVQEKQTNKHTHKILTSKTKFLRENLKPENSPEIAFSNNSYHT